MEYFILYENMNGKIDVNFGNADINLEDIVSFTIVDQRIKDIDGYSFQEKHLVGKFYRVAPFPPLDSFSGNAMDMNFCTEVGSEEEANFCYSELNNMFYRISGKTVLHESQKDLIDSFTRAIGIKEVVRNRHL